MQYKQDDQRTPLHTEFITNKESTFFDQIVEIWNTVLHATRCKQHQIIMINSRTELPHTGNIKMKNAMF
jgi:hypothetical protein